MGRGPLSYLPEPGLLLAEMIGGAVNVRARSRSGRAFRHGLPGVTSCNVCTGIYSSGEPYTIQPGLWIHTLYVDQVEDLPILGLLHGCCLQPCPLQSL